MFQLSDTDPPSWTEAHSAADPHRDRMADGLGASMRLHALAILAIVVLPWLAHAPLPLEQVAIPINLVILGEKTASPPSLAVTPQPQEQAREVSKEVHPETVPLPAESPSPAAARRAEDRSVRAP